MRILSAIPILIMAFSLVALFTIISLFGAAGQFFGFGEWANAAVALLLAVALILANAYLIKKFGQTLLRAKWGSLVAYLIFIVCAGVAATIQSYNATPEYQIENLDIKVIVHDVEGTTGDVETKVQIKFLKNGVNEIIWGGIGSTGVIKDVTANRLEGDFIVEPLTEGGLWQVRLHFTNPPKKGQQVGFVFRQHIVGAEPENHIEYVYQVKQPTKNLQMVFVPPKERPCKMAAAYSGDAFVLDDKLSAEHMPTLYNDNIELLWSKANPEQGKRYVVVCKQ